VCNLKEAVRRRGSVRLAAGVAAVLGVEVVPF
jgi:hypothetical protein